MLAALFSFFFFNDTATTEIYTLSLHDALPISPHGDAHREERAHERDGRDVRDVRQRAPQRPHLRRQDRKSTRLNSSHDQISYAVFCLKKKKTLKRAQLRQLTTWPLLAQK